MTFGHGKDSAVLVNEVIATGYTTDWSVSCGRELAPVTTLGNVGTRWLPGLVIGQITLEGLYDPAAATLHSETMSVLGVDNGLLATVFPGAQTIGLPAFFTTTDAENYSVQSTPTEAVKISIDAMPDAGVDWGLSLHATGAETADANAASVDNTASSANGGAAVLHVTAFSGLTNAVLKVQHSTDNSVWNDLVTFTTVTGLTAERRTVTGTVNRYIRCATDVTGTGSVTFAMAFARR